MQSAQIWLSAVSACGVQCRVNAAASQVTEMLPHSLQKVPARQCINVRRKAEVNARSSGAASASIVSVNSANGRKSVQKCLKTQCRKCL